MPKSIIFEMKNKMLKTKHSRLFLETIAAKTKLKKTAYMSFY